MRVNHQRLLRIVVLVAIAWLLANAADKPTPTRIVLDTTTFPKISRPLLQETADNTAKMVDELIPGDYPNGASSTILCFVSDGEWADKPRAVVGKRWEAEPAAAAKYDLRVALTPQVLPGAWQRLVFQLAHELAHHKMGPRADNNVFESFAVAFSLEVLHRMGYDHYREGNERFYSQWTPPEVMAALNREEWNTVGLYLRYEWRREYAEEWDDGTHFVAAMALRKMDNFPWSRLLNLGATAECGSSKFKGRAQYCPISPATLEGFPEPVKALLSPDPLKVVIVRTATEPYKGGGLTFREKGKWVTLRWMRKSDPVVPEGFVRVE